MIQAAKLKDNQTGMHSGRLEGRYNAVMQSAVRQSGSKAGRETGRQGDRQTGNQGIRQTGSRADRQSGSEAGSSDIDR